MVADFNRDGNADIVTANTRDRTLTLLLGDGHGHFTQAPGSPMPSPANAIDAIATGDFNNDGNPDLALTSIFGSAILLGDGAGGFMTGTGLLPSRSTFGGAGQLLTVADFNRDGKLDLIIASFNGSPYLFPGDGTGAFGPPQSIATAVFDFSTLLAGDFNGDGRVDLAMASRGFLSGISESLYVLGGDGAGHFQPIFAPSLSPYTMGPPLAASAAVGDFNGDGKPEILTFRYFGAMSQSQVWAWTGDPSANNLTAFRSTQSSVTSIPMFLAVADFNGDGKLDWAGVNPASGSVSVNLGDGTGAFTPAPGSPYSVGGAPFGLVAADFNGDGKTDLAVNTGSNVVLLLSSGNTAVPSIKEVDNAFSNLPNSPIEPGSWVAIKGTNLSNTSPGRGWNASESFPTSMDGTSVTINGKPAFLYYISPTQINVQAPDDPTNGTVTVVVTHNGLSATAAATYSTESPAFLQWGGGQYPYALVSRGTDYIGNPAIVPSTVPAHAGDSLTLWATGLGPTTPSIPAGQQPSTFPSVATTPTITVGGVNVTLLGAVLRYAGLYQINVQLPASLPAGDLAIKITQLTFQSPDGVAIHIQ